MQRHPRDLRRHAVLARVMSRRVRHRRWQRPRAVSSIPRPVWEAPVPQPAPEEPDRSYRPPPPGLAKTPCHSRLESPADTPPQGLRDHSWDVLQEILAELLRLVLFRLQLCWTHSQAAEPCPRSRPNNEAVNARLAMETSRYTGHRPPKRCVQYPRDLGPPANAMRASSLLRFKRPARPPVASAATPSAALRCRAALKPPGRFELLLKDEPSLLAFLNATTVNMLCVARALESLADQQI